MQTKKRKMHLKAAGAFTFQPFTYEAIEGSINEPV